MRGGAKGQMCGKGSKEGKVEREEGEERRGGVCCTFRPCRPFWDLLFECFVQFSVFCVIQHSVLSFRF